MRLLSVCLPEFAVSLCHLSAAEVEQPRFADGLLVLLIHADEQAIFHVFDYLFRADVKGGKYDTALIQ